MYKDLKTLELEAEQAFLNFGGEEDFDGYDEEFDDFDSYDEEYDEEYDEDYAGVMGKLGIADRTLLITVQNTNSTATAANIFGANKNLYLPNFGLPGGVVVNAPDSSYGQVLSEIQASPMLIKGIKMIVGNSAQFNRTLQFVRKEATGSEEKDPLQPSRYLSALQNQGTIVEMPGIKFPLDGKVELQSVYEPGHVTQFIFYVQSKIDLARATEGKSAIRTRVRRRRTK